MEEKVNLKHLHSCVKEVEMHLDASLNCSQKKKNKKLLILGPSQNRKPAIHYLANKYTNRDTLAKFHTTTPGLFDIRC
jgi:hypothetical protein